MLINKDGNSANKDKMLAGIEHVVERRVTTEAGTTEILTWADWRDTRQEDIENGNGKPMPGLRKDDDGDT